MIEKVFIQLATWFGVGKIKKASGTWATLATVPLAYALGLLGPFITMGFIVLLLPVGIVAADFYEKKFQTHDSSEIVIDEVIGFLITMTWLPLTWQSFVLGFILFRILDIFKPFPISYLDEKIAGGLGVVVDDVAAGMIANLVLQYLYSHTGILGTQMITV